MTSCSRAYNSGYQAYWQSKVLHSLPRPCFKRGTVEYRDWYEGLYDAQEDDMEQTTSSPADTGTEFPKLSS